MIPKGRARPVAFDQVNLVRRPSGGVIGHAHGSYLTFANGRQKTASHVIGKTDALDDRQNGVLIPYGILQTFQYKHAGTFPDNQPVCRLVKRCAPARRR